jgi:hypothetical protein
VNRSGSVGTWSSAAAIILVFCLAGCGMNRRYANNVIRQLPHSDVTIEYSCTKAPNAEAGDNATTPVAKQVLTIVYPHPSPKYDRKYAEVTLRHDDGTNDESKSIAVAQLVTNPFKKQEMLAAGAETDDTMRLAIPREELEFLLRDLVADSYFDREQRNGNVNLEVSLGSRTTSKSWDQIATFDQLAKRVTEEYGKRMGSRPAANRVTAASAELLPSITSDLSEEPATPPKRGARLHGVPEF